jgi:hypothetical protein
MRLNRAASAFVFHILCKCRDLATSVRKTYGTAIRLPVFGRDRLEEQAFGCGASCKMVSLIVGLCSTCADTYIRIFRTIGGILVTFRCNTFE